MRPRQKCVNCGCECEPEVVRYRKKQRLYGPLCKKCHKEDVARRAKEQAERYRKLCMEALAEKRCVVCGGEIAWKDAYLNKGPSRLPLTCCRRCHGIYSKRDYRVSKEDAEKRLKTALLTIGSRAERRTLLRAAHIAGKVLTRHGISIAVLKKEVFGITEPRVHSEIAATRQARPVLDIGMECGISTTDLKVIAQKVVRRREWDIKKKQTLLEDLLAVCISQQCVYVGVVKACRLLGLSYDSLIGHYKVDVARVNKELGYLNKRQSWFEETAYQQLCLVVGKDRISREHMFQDCRSKSKDFVLRFDFYIPDCKVLIEVDGSQHNDPQNGYFRQEQKENDAAKDAYASARGLRLIRVSTVPAMDFLSRFKSEVLDVLKPVELLEPRPDNAEGNQQPSLEKPHQLTFF